MPVAKIDLLESCSQEQKERLGQEMIELISRTVIVPRDRIKVIIQDRANGPDHTGGFTFIHG
ncbi:tautomerase family protein [Pontibacterium sp.]|uniref:tautomerase family protein n=1 Tax=Pontibacterium sp. TaxID=2036026 RepID=UPI00351505A1